VGRPKSKSRNGDSGSGKREENNEDVTSERHRGGAGESFSPAHELLGRINTANRFGN